MSMLEDNKTEKESQQYLVDIRDSIIYGLLDVTGLRGHDIAIVLNINRSTVSRILSRSRKDRSPKLSKFIKKIR